MDATRVKNNELIRFITPFLTIILPICNEIR